LVERFVYTEDVGSSSLSSPTIPTFVFNRIVGYDGEWRTLQTYTYDNVCHIMADVRPGAGTFGGDNAAGVHLAACQ
jgi:hypothetical protein